MKRFVIFYGSCLLSFTAVAQPDSVYQTLVAKAGLLHLQENYKNAIGLYEQAFQIQQPDALTAYKAAGMYSLDSNTGKAFQYLKLALSSGYTEADWLSFDPYFDYLKENRPGEWKSIKEKAFINESECVRTLRLPALRKEINGLALNDQRLRYKKVLCNNDSLLQIINRLINESDLNNLKTATAIIKQYGWPKISEIGRDGQNNLWLIVQHADQDISLQQKALTAMTNLKDKSEMSWENYAFLYDRVQCNLNYKQLYGTQVVWTGNGEASAFRPMIQEYMADERRAKMGLQPLRIYALTYGFSYQKKSAEESNKEDSLYNAQVQHLIDSAKFFYVKKDFQKTYDYYNLASTFLGGMSDADDFEAAVIFSKIAGVDSHEEYKSISLDFLDLLMLRGSLNKEQLFKQPDFKVLRKEQRWLDITKKLDK